MILYTLHCKECSHTFDAWFRDSEAFDRQADAGVLACPACEGGNVEKALMAPRLSQAKKSTVPSTDSAKAVKMASTARKAMKELRRTVEENCDYVADRFAEEARRIHYGEAEERGIYGEASIEEHKALKDEGIDAQRIPWIDRTEH